MGAKGDGVTDDTLSIQRTFKLIQFGPNTSVILGDEKTYLIHSGIDLGPTSIIEGNNSIIEIGNITDYMLGGRFTSILVMPPYYSGHMDCLKWSNLTFKVNPTEPYRNDETGKLREMNLLYLEDCDVAEFTNCKFLYTGNEKCNFNMIKAAGWGEINIEDCVFDVRHRGKVGSCLWIQSPQDNIGYTVSVSNSKFYSTAWDEIISIFCQYSHDVSITNCDIVKEFYDTYYTGQDVLEETTGPFLTTYYRGDAFTPSTDVHHNVLFKDCNMVFRSIDSNSTKYMTFLGIQSQYNSPAVTNFENCTISGKNIRNLVGGEDPRHLAESTSNEEYYNNVYAQFSNCDINIETDAEGIVNGASTNCIIKDSSLKTNVLLNTLYAQVVQTTHFLKLINNDITITGTNDYALQIHKAAKENYLIKDNRFNMHEGVQLFKILETDLGFDGENLKWPHLTGATFSLELTNSTINNILQTDEIIN